MKNALIENNYIVLPNFISKERASNLSFEFLKHCKENNLEGDSQAPNSYSAYNYTSFLELLCEKTPEISLQLEKQFYLLMLTPEYIKTEVSWYDM